MRLSYCFFALPRVRFLPRNLSISSILNTQLLPIRCDGWALPVMISWRSRLLLMPSMSAACGVVYNLSSITWHPLVLLLIITSVSLSRYQSYRQVPICVEVYPVVPCISPIQIAVHSVQQAELMVQYHTGDAAQACKVTLNTVRNWCRDYAAFLSPGASVTSGARVFNGRDMEVFKYIALLRAEGMQKGAIVQRLGETTFAEIDATQEDTAIASVDAQDARDGSFAPIVGQDYLMSIERRFEAMQASVDEVKRTPGTSQRDGVIMFGVGFIAALVFVVLLLLLFLLRHSL
jgi:DNA-binding transcriptional MerR regulator